MAKIPDFSELAKNLNIQGIVDSVKSVINPTSSVSSNPPSNDELAVKFAEVHGLIQNFANVHAQQAKEIANLNSKIDSLYKDMLALRKVSPAGAVVVESTEVTPNSASSDSDQNVPK